MKLTLDWNCVIEVVESQPQANDVLQLVEYHRAGLAQVALLAASASENTRSKRFPGSAILFRKRIDALGWSDLPLVRMPGVIGLSYLDFAYLVDDAAQFETKMDELWSVISPKVNRSPSKHLPEGREFDDDAVQSPDLAKWRNAWCDVISAYCHIEEGRDLFVTSNTRDFQKNASRLAPLGMNEIATPAEAVDRVRASLATLR